MEKLSKQELVKLVKSVFPGYDENESLAILVDVPKDREHDNLVWKKRRQIATEWYRELSTAVDELEMDSVHLYAYKSVGSNNADLPNTCCDVEHIPDEYSDSKEVGSQVNFEDVFQKHQLFLAPTQYSTTAPLKVAAKKYNFRAATMPGFGESMIPALRLDYGQVYQRVMILKELLDSAKAAQVSFLVDDNELFAINFDLRFRPAHASSGRFPDKGTAGNLPSGETYIVPYEGENEPSLTKGTLPVQFEDEIVLFKIIENKAVAVISAGDKSDEQAEYLLSEPAYGNMAELGFGVLADFGLKPIGEVLLDEKLGFHVAFGRSEHFGGQIGPAQFSAPNKVVHIDRIYIPETQPKIAVKSIILEFEDKHLELLKDGKYLIF